jgi:nucleoside-diphosphate-sugar epimerase
MQKWVNDDVYDASAFQRDFNFQPQVSLNDGLQREVAWYNNTTKRK